jgi:catechol 2,3-dioxygenase-like lactoylglutathione lyase family enzyme
MRIRIVTLYVTDQDKARAFYTEKLGFRASRRRARRPSSSGG